MPGPYAWTGSTEFEEDNLRLIFRWAANTLAILAAAYLLPEITVTSVKSALIAALLLGVLNTFVCPIFRIFALPVTLLTLGLFVLVVNGFVLKILDWFMGDYFVIHGFFWAIAGAVIISIVTTMINVLLGSDKKGNPSTPKKKPLAAPRSFPPNQPPPPRAPLVLFLPERRLHARFI